MPRLVSVLCAALLLTACDSKDSGSTQDEPKSADPAPKAPVLACRADDVQALAEAVRAATVERRGEVVAQGLPKACELPAGVEAYLAATEPGASEDSRVRALREGSSMLTEICDDIDTLQEKASKLEASRRAEMLYDACGLGRLNLVDRSAWLRSRPTSVMPFVALEWLKRQGASADEAKAIASALLLRGKRTWGLAGQRVVTVDGHLEPIPEGAIEVAITSKAIFVEGVSVVEHGLIEARVLFGGEHPAPKNPTATISFW